MNSKLLENLNILAEYHGNKNDSWRQKAYFNAIDSIKLLNFKVTTIDQVKGIHGIGKSITANIHEYIQNGMINRVEEIKRGIPKSLADITIEEFQKIWGVGPVKSRSLWDSGMRSLKDIKANQHLLNANQKIGLKYYRDLQKQIPKSCIDMFKDNIRNKLNQKFGSESITFKIAGSYRRGANESGDIDCLISGKTCDLEDIVIFLKEKKIITDILSMKKEKFMGIARAKNHGHLRLDIEFLPEHEFQAGLLYFTGSRDFNISMRSKAKKLGYVLNQHGLFKGNERVHAYTEKEIMNMLGMEFISPKDR